jgi:hypothetical protein
MGSFERENVHTTQKMKIRKTLHILSHIPLTTILSSWKLNELILSRPLLGPEYQKVNVKLAKQVLTKHFGPYCTYHSFPENMTYAVLFT